MKHLTPRDILESILFLICFTAIFAFAGLLETAPLALSMWMAAILGLILWVLYFVIVCQQRKAEANNPTLWMRVNGQWIAQDGTGRLHPASQEEANRRIEPAIFDQNDYKE